MIPKIVYQTWYNKTLPPYFQRIVRHNQRINPEYEFRLFDNQDLIQFFEECRHDYPIISSAFFRINPRYGAAKADLFRYMIIYLNGGIYMDIKIECHTPFHQWIDSSKKGYLSYWTHEKHNEDLFQNGKGELQNWFLIFQPKDEHLLQLLNAISYQIMNAPYEQNHGKRAVLIYTGPIIYTQQMLSYVHEYQFFTSETHLVYHANPFQNEHYQHYSQLSDPLFLNWKTTIPLRIFHNSSSIKDSGIYIWSSYTMLASVYDLIRNCNLFFVMYDGNLFMLAFDEAIISSYLSTFIQQQRQRSRASPDTNTCRVFYDNSFCIKQGYFSEEDRMVYFDSKPYCQFHKTMMTYSPLN